MTDEAPSAAEIARRLRSVAPETVLARSGSTTGGRLHLPHPDDDGILCEVFESGDYSAPLAKPLAAFPPGYHAWCSRCAWLGLEDLDRQTVEAVDGELRCPVAADGGGGE